MPLASILQSFPQALNDRFGPEGMKNFLFVSQIGVGALFVLAFLKLRSGSKSGFAVREADLRLAKERKPGTPDPLASARMDRKTPLRLEGIRIDGPPHEVLGVALGATEEQIQRAYRERMKQYHPDKVGRPGSREWTDAQKIAEAINHAKNELIRRARSK